MTLTNDWQPFCGIPYPLEKTAGDPLICDAPPHDVESVRHHNSETGFSWWHC